MRLENGFSRWQDQIQPGFASPGAVQHGIGGCLTLTRGDTIELRRSSGPVRGAALYRRTMLDQIGFFDEDFFMYMEDVDLAVPGTVLRLEVHLRSNSTDCT